MSSTSEYWYERKEIPPEEKQKIKKLAKGKPVGTFQIDGTEHQLLEVSGEVFRKAFIENRKFLYKGDYTAPSNENDYSDSTNYLSEDGLAGFSITDTGWLVSLFSNYRKSGFAEAIKDYVKKKAYKLVCIVADTEEGNELVELYKKLYGFRKYVTTINDLEIMRRYYGDEFIHHFVTYHGIPFHIFMIGPNAVGEESEIRRFDDYFEAEAYVDRTVSLL